MAVTTDFINIRLYLGSILRRQIIPLFKRCNDPYFNAKVVEIVLFIKGRVQAVTKKLQRADHAIIEIRMTCIVNEASPIYIHWEMYKTT